MKKTLLSMLFVAFAGVAMAQTTDPFDGKTMTFTNKQQGDIEYTLYINDNGELAVSDQTAEVLGEAAQFKCQKQASGKYSLYNEAKELYMIWRNNTNGGYNGGKGVLDTYNATYCDWEFKSAETTVPGTMYFVGKRNNGTTDGTLVIMKNNKAFDAWGNTIGYSSTYSNIYSYTIDGEDPMYEYEYELTDNAGNIHTITKKGCPSYLPFIPTIANISYAEIDAASWNDNYTKYSGTIDLKLPVSNEKEDANAIMIGSFATDSKANYGELLLWYTQTGEHINITKGSAPTGDTFLWAIYPTMSENGFTFKIKNLSNNKYIYTEASYANDSGCTDTTPVVFLKDNGTEFQLNYANKQFYYVNNNVTHYLSFGSTTTPDGYLGVFARNHAGTHKALFNTNLNVGEAGWASLYQFYKVAIPEGVTAYTVSDVDGEEVTLSEVTGVVLPANTAVLVKAEAGNYTFKPTAEEAASIENNALAGVTRNTTITPNNDSYYILADGDNGIGLYIVDEDPATEGYEAFTLAASKAYLRINGAAESNGFSFRIEGTTGIDEVKGENEKVKAIYDLTSRIVAMSFCEPRSWRDILSS